jgi:hypothetical protein
VLCEVDLNQTVRDRAGMLLVPVYTLNAALERIASPCLCTLPLFLAMQAASPVYFSG